ncbi:hypothetical protein [uncultured Mucilaginibacter sp.]|uniref:hypothetical protein n=1 Tax=uncultured Mucilaginibacter sp. TaxID=797541 RepID=UPI0025FEEBD7|nr:hypothetical protein [uncultured Mucilaginibacter sp.]
MPNIKFSYLYRDGANYKNYSYVVFKGEQTFDVDKLQTLIQSKLISGEFFYATNGTYPIYISTSGMMNLTTHFTNLNVLKTQMKLLILYLI